VATESARSIHAASDLDLGPRLRALRRSKRLTLRELADRAAITESFLSQVERGVASPSIATVQRIARALGLSIAELFSERSSTSLVRRADRDRISYPGLRAVDEFLTSAPNGRLQIILSTIEPGGGTGEEPYTHDSDEEVVIILEGQLDVWVDEEHHVLREGDALTLASRTPHRNTNRGDRPCRVLFCITPPSY
jgi:transcriptional regulator with XRE-family HTH domain